MIDEKILTPEEFEKVKNFYQGKRVAVTGSSGFLGSALIDILSGISCRLVCLSRSGIFPKAKGRAEFIFEKAVYDDEKFWEHVLPGTDFVFHFAGQTSAAEAETHPDRDFQANVRPLTVMLEVCRRKNLKPAVIFSGTVTQAGIPEKLPVDESAPSNPLTVYDRHKQTAEDELKNYSRQTGAPGVCLRLANVYGPGRQVSSVDRGVLNQMIRRALAGQALTVYGEGRQIRDYLFITDAVRAFLLAGVHADELAGKHFMIGSGQGQMIRDAFQMIRECAEIRTGKSVSVEFMEPPPGRPRIDARNFIADFGNFSEKTGWKPLTGFREGVERSF